MRGSSLGDPLVSKIAVILELPLVQVFQDALFLFGRFLDALIEFIPGRVFYFLPFSFYRFCVARTINAILSSGLARGWHLLRLRHACRNTHHSQQTQE
jgi:hypothetical protein